jgi:ParB family chromosome partitioning protein
MEVRDIPQERIRVSPTQARKHFDQASLEELAESMRQLGFFTRLRVRPDPSEEGFFRLVFGERRLRAAKIAGITMIPCEIADDTDDRSRKIGIIENIHRSDLEPLEEAMALQNLLDQKDPRTGKKYSIRSLATYLGKPKSYIEQRLTLLRLPEDIKEVLTVQPRTSLRALIEVSKITSPAERAPLVQELKEGMLSTEEARAIVRAIQANRKQAEQAEEPAEETPSWLVFERTLNHNTRRTDSALTELERIAYMYKYAPDKKSKDALLKHIQATSERIQQIKEIISQTGT